LARPRRIHPFDNFKRVIPTVWFVGTSGVGKTTVGSQLQNALERRGTRAAFVDADQLRNTAGVDSTEDEFVADGLRAIAPEFERAGARLLIVAGMVDDDASLARLLPEEPRSNVLVVHLHAAGQTVVDRVVRRQWNVELANDSVEYSQNFDRGWVDVTIDTTDLSTTEVVERLIERVVAIAKSPRIPDSDPTLQPPLGAVVIVVAGAGGVGLSSAGFLTFLQGMWGGERIGYVDSHQVGFIGVDPRATELAALRARNSVAVAAVMARRGVEHVVVTADPATSRTLVEIAHPEKVFWLDASDHAIESRHRSRAAGGGPPLAGDHRLGLDEDGIQAGVAAAIIEARDTSIRPPGHVVLDTDSASADEVASQITAARKS
jgi:hypothetical protein